MIGTTLATPPSKRASSAPQTEEAEAITAGTGVAAGPEVTSKLVW